MQDYNAKQSQSIKTSELACDSCQSFVQNLAEIVQSEGCIERDFAETLQVTTVNLEMALKASTLP